MNNCNKIKLYVTNNIKTGQKAYRSKLVGTTGHGDQKWDNTVLNGTYGHLIIVALAN